MAKTVRNVMAGVSKDKQLRGLTLDEIRAEFMLAGYGLTKAEKRAKELLLSAQLQTDGRTDERGRILYFSIFWPWAYDRDDIKLEVERVGAIEYIDARHTQLRRLDGRKQPWDLTIAL